MAPVVNTVRLLVPFPLLGGCTPFRIILIDNDADGANLRPVPPKNLAPFARRRPVLPLPLLLRLVMDLSLFLLLNLRLIKVLCFCRFFRRLSRMVRLWFLVVGVLVRLLKRLAFVVLRRLAFVGGLVLIRRPLGLLL